MKDQRPERESWLLLLGAALVSAESRDAVVKAVRPEDFPEGDLRGLAQALAGKDTTAVKHSLEGWRIKMNGTVLESVIERVAVLVANKAYSREFARLNAASNCESTLDLEQVAVDTVERLSRLIATKGRTQ